MSKVKGRTGFIVWASVSAFLIALIIVVNILATTMFYELINLVLNGPRPIFDSTQEKYFISEYDSKKEVYNAARDFNERIAEEGIVLLKNKNNNALPIFTPVSDSSVAKRPRISIFGKNSVNLAYGGSGSGGSDGSKAVNLYTALNEAGYDCNPTLRKFYENDRQSGGKRASSGSDLDSGDTVVLSTAETPQSRYTAAIRDSYASDYNDVAIVVFTRVGGEGMDLPRTMKGASGYNKEDDHFLQFDKNETELLKMVCDAKFGKVVVVLNVSAAMEVGFLEDPDYYAYQEKIDAALWMGYPGVTGTRALARILNGSVNPSGHTVDTFVKDLKKDPTWNNFGDNLITGNPNKGVIGGDEYSLNGKPLLYYFVDYEEGVYVGYRYYETRGVTDGEAWYDNAVVYPFGHGLSYSTFTWTIDDSAIRNKTITKNGKYEVKVKVHNNGPYKGKDVVQLYGHAPYTPGRIEKPDRVLLDFAKTEEIEVGGDKEVTLTFDPYYLASYDYKDQNNNTFKGYELDAGTDYALYVSTDSHNIVFEIPFACNGLRFEKSTVNAEVDVKNRYTDQENEYFDSDTQLSTVLSRSAWEATWPTPPDDEEREVTREFVRALEDKETNNPDDFMDDELPWTDEDNGLRLRELWFDENGDLIADENGLPYIDYEDERWDALLDQMSAAEMRSIYNYAAYKINRASSVGLPIVNCSDGPVGWTCFMNASVFYDTCSYTAQAVVGATWSKDLAYEFGQMVGDEGLIGNAKTGEPYSGWYAPGVNIHRSAFGGRNFEYYSEDPTLSGKMAAAQIRGVQSKGAFAFVKHFALNEQETHRSIGGDCSWVTEQAMREIFLRPFEYAVKEGGTRAVMSSFNRIGTRWTGGDYRLITEILRDEWGFKGTVLCDFNTIPQYMNSKQMAYAGGDLNLATLPEDWCDSTDTADMVVMRKCMKNVLYTVGNSNAINLDIVGYKLPIWQIIMIVVDVVLSVGIAIWGFFAIWAFVKKESFFAMFKKNKTVAAGEGAENTEASVSAADTTPETNDDPGNGETNDGNE